MFNISLYGPASLPVQPGPSYFVPTAPDYAICDRQYGAHLLPLMCGRAADTLIQGNSFIPYTVRGGAPGPRSLPYTATFGE